MPAHIEATVWVSALAEPVTTFFGIIAVYGVLEGSGGGSRWWKPISVAAFCLALMTHESAVVLLPLFVLADWAFLPSPAEHLLAAPMVSAAQALRSIRRRAD